MAWLITLALFWGIGTAIFTTKDRKDLAKAKRKSQRVDGVQHFLSEVYVLAWHYYVPLEVHAMEAWIEQHQAYTINEFAPDNYSINEVSRLLFGRPIQEMAIGQAIGHMRQDGRPIYSLVPEASVSDYYAGWTQTALRIESDGGATITGIQEEIPSLAAPYRWDYARLAEHAGYLRFIPERGDVNSASYQKPYYDGKQWGLRYESREVR